MSQVLKTGHLCLGVRCKDGVVLAFHKVIPKRDAYLQSSGSSFGDNGDRRIQKVEDHIGMLPVGHPSDGRALIDHSRSLASGHR